MKSHHPLPQAGHLDNPQGGESEARLLEARIKTLEELGEGAMSPHDLKNGYTPAGIIRLLRGQIDFLRDNSPETIHAKANLATGHNLERRRLEKKGLTTYLPISGQATNRSSLEEIRLHLDHFVRIQAKAQAENATSWQDGLGRSWALYLLRDELLRLEALYQDKTKNTGPPMEDQEKTNPQGGETTGAAILFEQTSEIRAAISTLKSEQRETRKLYKKAIATLDQALASIYNDYDDKQLRLFDETPSLPDEVEKLLDHPTVLGQ